MTPVKPRKERTQETKRRALARLDQKRIENNLTPERSLSNHATARPIVEPLSVAQLQKYERLKTWFGKYASGLRGMLLGTTRCFTFAQALAPNLPAWDKNHLAGFVLFIVASTKVSPRDGKRSMNTALDWMYAIGLYHRRTKGIPIAKEVQDFVKRILEERKGPLSFRDQCFPRAELTAESLRALAQACWRPDLDWSPRVRLDMLLYIGIAAVTGMRSASVLQYGVQLEPGNDLENLAPDVQDAQTASNNLDKVAEEVDIDWEGFNLAKRSEGVTWSDFRFIVDVDGLAVWFRSQDGKNSSLKGRWMVLGKGPTMGLAPGHVAFIAAWSDGVFGDSSPVDLLAPVGPAGPRRVLRMLGTRSVLHVFRGTSSRAWSSGSVNSRLKTLSIKSGFEYLVTCHCFRHMVIQYINLAFNFDHAKLHAGHGTNSGHQPYLGKGALAGKYGSVTTAPGNVNLEILKTTAIPDPCAPHELTLAEIDEVHQDERVRSVVKAFQECRDELLEEFGSIEAFPDDLAFKYNGLNTKKYSLVAKLLKQRLEAKRGEYFMRRKAGEVSLTQDAEVRTMIIASAAQLCKDSLDFFNRDPADFSDVSRICFSLGSRKKLRKLKPVACEDDDLDSDDGADEEVDQDDNDDDQEDMDDD